MRAVKLLVCVLLSLLLTGCWDAHELENNTYIIIMGLDLAEDGDVVVTIAFPLTQSGESAQKQGESPRYETMSVRAATILEGLNLFTVELSSSLALYALKTVVLSEAFACGGKLPDLLSAWRTEQMRNTASVLVTVGDARAFIEARVNETVIDPLRQEELFLEQTNNSAYSAAVKFLDLIVDARAEGGDGVAMYGGVRAEDVDGRGERARQDADGYLPGEVPLQGKSINQISGLAVFSGGSMVGALDSDQAQTYAMLIGSKTRKLLTLPDPLVPGGRLVVSITSPAGARVACAIERGEARFDLTLRLRCTLESVERRGVYAEPQNFQLLKAYIRETCEKKLTALLDVLQRSYQADILHLGNKAKRHFATLEDWARFDWPSRYPDAVIRLTVELDIAQTGILQP